MKGSYQKATLVVPYQEFLQTEAPIADWYHYTNIAKKKNNKEKIIIVCKYISHNSKRK
jgi:hypothetical protein